MNIRYIIQVNSDDEHCPKDASGGAEWSVRPGKENCRSGKTCGMRARSKFRGNELW